MASRLDNLEEPGMYDAEQSKDIPALEQLSEVQLQDISDKSEEDPSFLSRLKKVWDRTQEGFGKAYDQAAGVPEAVGAGFSRAGERVAEAPAKIATGAKKVAGEVSKGLENVAERSAQLSPEPEPGALTLTAKPGEVSLDIKKEESQPTVADTKSAEQLDQTAIDAVDAKLAEATPATVEAAIAAGTKDFSKMRVPESVYKDYIAKLDSTLADYKAEVEVVRKAKLWTGLLKAAGLLFMARYGHGTMGPEQMKWDLPDFNADLVQAGRSLDAVRSTEKAKLEERQRSTGEERAVYNIEQEDVKGAEIKANRKERDEARAEDKTIRTEAKKLADDQRLATTEANRLTKRKDDLVKGINKVLDDKKLDKDEKISRIDALTTSSGLPMSAEAKAKLGRKVGMWGMGSLDKEARQDDLNFILDTEINPYIENIRAGVKPKDDKPAAEPTTPAAVPARPKANPDPNVVTLYNPKTGESGHMAKDKFEAAQKQLLDGGYEVVK